MNKKILVACPTSDYKKYCQDDWLNHISRLTYKCDLLIIENSQTTENSILIKKTLSELVHNFNKVIVLYQKPSENIKLTLVDCCNVIREFAINGNYDAWVSIESDIFPPYNVIEHLILMNKPICCCTYFHFGGSDTKLLHYVLEDVGNNTFVQTHKTFDSTYLEDSVSHELKETTQPGLGCLYCDIKVLKKVPFRYSKNEYADGYHDYFFHIDLQRLGIKVYTDFSVIVEHRNNQKNWQEILKKEKNKLH